MHSFDIVRRLRVAASRVTREVFGDKKPPPPSADPNEIARAEGEGMGQPQHDRDREPQESRRS